MILRSKLNIRNLCLSYNAKWLNIRFYGLMVALVLSVGCGSTASNRIPTGKLSDNSFTLETESLVYSGIVNTWTCTQHLTLAAAKNDVAKLEKEFEFYMAQDRSNAQADRYFNSLQSFYGCKVVNIGVVVSNHRLEGVSERGDKMFVKCSKKDRAGKLTEAGEELNARAENALEILLARQATLYRMVRSDNFEIDAYIGGHVASKLCGVIETLTVILDRY